MNIDILSPVDPLPDAKDLEAVSQWAARNFERVNKQFELVTMLITGLLDFGSSTTPGNISGTWVSYTTGGAEDTVAHGLTSIPLGVIVMIPPQYGFISVGPTAWDVTNVYLQCGETGQAVTIFVVASP